MACCHLLSPRGAEYPKGPAWSPVWGEKPPPAQTVSVVNWADPAWLGSSAKRVRQRKAGRAAGLIPRGLWRDPKAMLELASPLHCNVLPR